MAALAHGVSSFGLQFYEPIFHSRKTRIASPNGCACCVLSFQASAQPNLLPRIRVVSMLKHKQLSSYWQCMFEFVECTFHEKEETNMYIYMVVFLFFTPYSRDYCSMPQIYTERNAIFSKFKKLMGRKILSIRAIVFMECELDKMLGRHSLKLINV